MREKLAELSHISWSRWMRYLFSKCHYISGCAVIPEDLVVRWKRQMNTPYEDLPPEEQTSDLMEAEKVLRVVNDHVFDIVVDQFASAQSIPEEAWDALERLANLCDGANEGDEEAQKEVYRVANIVTKGESVMDGEVAVKVKTYNSSSVAELIPHVMQDIPERVLEIVPKKGAFPGYKLYRRIVGRTVAKTEKTFVEVHDRGGVGTFTFDDSKTALGFIEQHYAESTLFFQVVG